MGILSSLLLFVSVVLHELSHSLVAMAKNIKVQSITLFFFGGVAGIEKEDMEPGAEFMMAIAGPLFSLLLAGVFYFINAYSGNVLLSAITSYLYQLNFVLAIFNLVPGFPLDGGRAFRAILFAYTKDLVKATRIAAAGGKVVAGLLLILGIFGMVTGTGGGLWFILLGAFLYFLAGMSYEQVVIKEALRNVTVKEIMKTKFSALSPTMTIQEFFRKYPAVEDEVLLVKGKQFTGLLSLNQISAFPEHATLQQVSRPLAQVKGLRLQDTAYTAFRGFAEQQIDLLPVIEKGKICGLVTKNAVLHHLQWELRYTTMARRLVQKHHSQHSHK
ncbi:site-2 protease family protein [Candidatus Woesearchaeota archaeon]|nr:site-2 protease family protein [Candidatus Woesearchaeota archaeon]